VDRRYQWYRHSKVLGNVLERVARGELARVMVFAPPRHGKSLQVSRLFPAYYLSMFPDRWVGLASYAAELAYTHSRAARDYYVLGKRSLRGDAAAVKHWETGGGGGFWATGVGGPATGKGFHIGIIDDPIKNAEEARSEVIREKQWDWLRSVFYSREEPGGAIILILTRWNEDDIAGRALAAEEEEEDEREGWHVVRLPAVAEEAAAERPAFSMEPDWRSPGEALCPERYPIEKLRRLEQRLGPYYWAALYQQRPRPREGSLLKWAWFEIVDAVPANARRVRYWDTAGTEGAGDYTAGCLMSRAPDGIFYIEDLARGQWAPGRRDLEIQAVAKRDKALSPRVEIWLEQESGVAGKERTQATIKALAGWTVHAEAVTGEKTFRAEPLAAQAEVGNVKVVRGTWNHAMLTEFCEFPYGKNDDQVDAASGALNKLLLEPVHQVTAGHMRK
jgi:predicted phage terminase large subunit-like protein